MRRRALGALLGSAVWALAAAAALADSPEIVVSPDDRFLYVGGSATTSFQRDAATGALVRMAERAPGASSLAITPDGRHLYGAWGEGIHVLSRDTATGVLTHETTVMEGTAGLVDIAVSPDGRHLYGVNANAGEIAIFERDAGTGGIRRTGGVYGGDAPGEVPWLEVPRAVSVSPDGSSVYVAVAGVGAFARDPATGALTPVMHSNTTSGSAFDVAVSSDGSRVYSGRGDVTALARDAGTGELTELNRVWSPCERFPMCNEGWSIAPSPDGSLVMGTRHIERNLVQAAVVPDGLTRQQDYVEGQDGAFGLDNPLELAWSRDSRFLYVGAARNLWFENGEFYISDANDLLTVAVYRREAGSSRLTPIELTRVAEAGPGPRAPTVNGQTVTINHGALFTRSPVVTVTINGGAYSARISNDGTFGGPATRIPTGGLELSWRLEDTGLGRDVRRVHVRFTWAGRGTPLRDISDDIVLDQRPPELTAARAQRTGRRSARLRLRASDNRSGVRKLQITGRRARPGRGIRFRRAMTVRRRLPHRAWARVIDGAGNRSAWRRVRLTHQSTG